MSYLKTIFCVTGFAVLLVAGINFMANPLGIYNPPLIKGFNDAYPAATVYSRLEKTEAVKRLKPDVIVTGSSRADIGLDPRPEFFSGLTAYDFGLPASSLNEQRRTLEFTQAVHPLKMAIITLDYFSFNARKLENKQFDPARLSPEAAASPARAFFDSYGTLVSLDMLIASIKNMRYIRHLDKNSYSLPNGHRIISDIAYDAALHGAAHLFEHPPAAQETAVDDFGFAYSDAPDDTTFKHLQAMLDLARQRNIRVILMISPVHFEPSQKPKEFETEWKKRIVEVVRANAARYGAKPYPLWDFDYPNSITLERVPAHGDAKTQMKWFWDPGHYKTATGDLMLAKILGLQEGKKYPDFGKKL